MIDIVFSHLKLFLAGVLPLQNLAMLARLFRFGMLDITII